MFSNPFNRFLILIQRSLDYRRRILIPPIEWLVVIVSLGVALLLLLAFIFTPDGQARSSHFLEGGALTPVSAIFLAMASGFAGASFFLSQSREREGWYPYFWLLAALGVGFLAFDELWQFHEKFGRYLDATAALPIFRSWNDVIVIAYGIAALPILMYFLPEIFRYPKFTEIIAMAFMFYFIHTLIDSAMSPPTTYSIIFEESAKLFCSAYLAIGMFVGLLGVIFSGTHTSLNQT